MASLDRRLWQSKIHADTLRWEAEAVVSGETMRRLNDEKLDAHEEALKGPRVREIRRGDRPILERVERHYEEVEAELTSAS